MGVLRVNRVAVVALLLAALVCAGYVGHGHDHDPMVGVHGHADLPSFSGGHDQAVPTPHVEGATRIESPRCQACVHKQRQRVAESRAVAIGGLEADSSSVEVEGSGQAVAGTSRLPASRAPPSA